MNKKTALPVEDVIRAAYFCIVKGYPQQDVCEMLGVSNVGRVAEAVVAIRMAAENPKRARAAMEAAVAA
jgi:hypothetical protein